MANERLRSAMARAQADIEAITRATGVDPKTVQRWLNGRIPHPRHRWAIANLLGEDEGYLWPAARPDLSPGAEATSEVVAAYGHRADIPNTRWSDLMATVRRQIDLLGYAFLFLPEQFVDLALSIEHKCASGCKVRIALADPDGTQTQERDALEQLDGTLPARIRTTLGHLRDVLTVPGVELRFHNVHLYNAIYRFDDEMIVTPYLYRAHGFQHPAFRLRRLGPYGVFASFADQFETIWATATPAQNPVSLANQPEVWMGRVDYYHDPNAPRANSLVPGASAIVVNHEGKLLLHRRSDNARWALPGGVMDIGESIAQTVTREVREETGLEVEPEYIVGIYSDPGHVFAYDDGEVRQQFSVCFACRIVAGQVRTSEESSEVAFFAPAEVDILDMHESIRVRIRHYLERRPQAVIA